MLHYVSRVLQKGGWPNLQREIIKINIHNKDLNFLISKFDYAIVGVPFSSA